MGLGWVCHNERVPELLHTALNGLPPPKIGKVREVYDLGSELLIIATDRISAFDVVMANGIPDKGAILTQISNFWFKKLGSIVPNHFLTSDLTVIEQRVGAAHPELALRSTLAKKAKVIPFECVARGYLTGSLFKEYKSQGGQVHGFSLSEGLLDGAKLAEPIFTPATKAEAGHDENVSLATMKDKIGGDLTHQLEEVTLTLYRAAAEHAEQNGIILADTKFEFGINDDGLLLIDEALTPDSSRFWEAKLWKPGQIQPSFDKQYVRDFLESIHFNKQPPGPTLPDNVTAETRAKYMDAYLRIVGAPFPAGAN